MAKKPTVSAARPRLKVPKYRRHSSRDLGFVEWSGKRHYFGKFNSPESLEAYSRFLAEHVLRDSAELPRTTQPSSPAAAPATVVEVVDAYWQHAKTYYRKNGQPSPHLGNLKPMLSLLKSHYGSTPAAEFGPLRLKALQAVLVKRGVSRKHINATIQRAVRVFKWAAGEQLIRAEVWTALTTVEGLKQGRTKAAERKAVPPVDDAIVDATLPHLPAVVADMVRVQRLTGCRPGEVCTLRPCDLDRSNAVWAYTPASHKMEHKGRPRVVMIGPKAQAILAPYLDRSPDTPCFSPAESEAKRLVVQHANRKTPLSCGNRPGSRKKKRRPKAPPRTSYDKSTYAQAVGRACQRAWPFPATTQAAIAGLMKARREKTATAEQLAELERLIRARTNWRPPQIWSPNQLRHAAATEIRKQHGIEGAQVVLGHSRADVTQIYAERDLTLAAQIAAEMG